MSETCTGNSRDQCKSSVDGSVEINVVPHVKRSARPFAVQVPIVCGKSADAVCVVASAAQFVHHHTLKVAREISAEGSLQSVTLQASRGFVQMKRPDGRNRPRGVERGPHLLRGLGNPR